MNTTAIIIIASIIALICIIMIIFILNKEKIKNKLRIIKENINNKKEENKLKCYKPFNRKKIILFILISIITILAIIQTFLLATLILSTIAYALAVPTSLLTILTICIYFKN